MFADDFSGDSISSDWKVIVGKWLLKAGALTTAPSNGKDQGTIRKELSFGDAVLQFGFKFARGGVLHLSVTGVNGYRDHIFRVMLKEQGFDLRKDGSKNDPSDVATVLDSAALDFVEGRWYTMLVEMLGQQVLARVGESHVLGTDPKISRPKEGFGFPMGGGVLLDNVAVWKGTANPGWTVSKTKLQARQSQRTGPGSGAGTRPR